MLLTDGTTSHTITIPYNHALNNAQECAIAFLMENGIKPIGRALRMPGMGRNVGKSILIHNKADSRKLFWLFVPTGKMTEQAVAEYV